MICLKGILEIRSAAESLVLLQVWRLKLFHFCKDCNTSIGNVRDVKLHKNLGHDLETRN